MTRQDTDRASTAARQAADRVAVDVATVARRLGITPDAVRGRLHRGTLEGERRPGGQWVVFLDPEPATDTGDRPATGSQQDATGHRQAADSAVVGELRARVDDQMATIADLRSQLERRDDDLRRRDAELERKDVLLHELMRKIPDAAAMLPAEIEAADYRRTADTADQGQRDQFTEVPRYRHRPSMIADLWRRLHGR